MAKLSNFAEYVMLDLFAEFDGITIKSMFGGYGLYYQNRFFAIIAEDSLYFKAQGEMLKEYQKLGSRQFVYSQGNHPETKMSYWTLPEEFTEDKQILLQKIQASASLSRVKDDAKNSAKKTQSDSIYLKS